MRARALLPVSLWFLGCGAEGSDFGAPVVDLRADTNRNGTVELDSATEDAQEDSWDETHGAIFLPNLDDDEHACPTGEAVPDADLAACHDAADEQINGDADLVDLARLQVAPWSDAPVGTTAWLEVSAADRVRLFLNLGTAFEAIDSGRRLSLDQIRQGVEIAVEGRDVQRDPVTWDGLLDVTLRLQESPGATVLSDTVRMRQAPWVMTHHLAPASRIFATDVPGVMASEVFRGQLDAAAAAAAVPLGLSPLPSYGGDAWTQDHFEVGYVSMPAAGGTHALALLLRGASVRDPDDVDFPLRPAGRVVFDVFRGVDVGAVQQFDLTTPQQFETLNSLGNLEAIPPYELAGTRYPHGRMLIGSTDTFRMDQSLLAFLDAQRAQPPLALDTSWLHVGHVDEVFTFVPAASPRGWALVVNDPVSARDLLQEIASGGHGAALLFEGLWWTDDIRSGLAAVSVAEVLADPDVMAASADAAIEIEAMLDDLRDATGITDSEMIRVPCLHTRVFGRSLAYQPNPANGLVLSVSDYAVAEPHGPSIDGADPFRERIVEVFGEHGITVHFLEDWDVYHRLNGDVHCASNAQRDPLSDPPWWEGGR